MEKINLSNYIKSVINQNESFDLTSLRYSKSFKNVLRDACDLANSYAHDYVGIEHVLACLLDLPELKLFFEENVKFF